MTPRKKPPVIGGFLPFRTLAEAAVCARFACRASHCFRHFGIDIVQEVRRIADDLASTYEKDANLYACIGLKTHLSWDVQLSMAFMQNRVVLFEQRSLIYEFL